MINSNCKYKRATAHLMVLLMIAGGGCVGIGPSTQEGALAGAAAGAAAGAIIGHNRSDGASLEGALIGAALGSLAGGVWGNRIDHETGRIYDSKGQAYSQKIYKRIPRPPRRLNQPERIGEPPAIGAIWISAHWEFFDGGYR